MKVQISDRKGQFSFAYGPATTKGADLSWETKKSGIDFIGVPSGMVGVLLFEGRAVLGVDSLEFGWKTQGTQNRANVIAMLDLMRECPDSGPVVLTVEDEPFRFGFH